MYCLHINISAGVGYIIPWSVISAHYTKPLPWLQQEARYQLTKSQALNFNNLCASKENSFARLMCVVDDVRAILCDYI